MAFKEEILNILKQDKNKWVKGSSLSSYLIWKNRGHNLPQAYIRQCIAQLRLEGNIIIAGNKGYMLTDNIESISKYIKSRWSELVREMKPLKEIARAAGTQNLLKLEIE